MLDTKKEIDIKNEQLNNVEDIAEYDYHNDTLEYDNFNEDGNYDDSENISSERASKIFQRLLLLTSVETLEAI